MPTYKTIIDARDGTSYQMVQAPNGSWWSVKNLAFVTSGFGSWDYDENPANRPIYGRLYTWDIAVVNCPAGHHVATDADWDALSADFGGDYAAAAHLKNSSGWYSGGNGDNSSGFAGLPGGLLSGGFGEMPQHGLWWTGNDSGANGSVRFMRWDTTDIVHYLLDKTTNALSVRFVEDPPPDAPAFYGSPFEGFEAGTVSVEIDRKLTLVDTLGGRPVLIPYAPADKDEWLVTAEFWTSAAQAREIERRTPPRGSPVYPGISVPARYGENTFAGLAPAAANGSADTYIDPIMLQPLEVLGQKAVRVDLYGYRASFSLSCSSVSNPYSSNPATAPTTTPPAWLPRKWRVHSIEDGSNERRVIGPGGKWTGSGNPIAANAIRPLSIQCDHLTTEQANELVAFFRGIRGNLFNLGFYPGPVGVHIPANPDFVATKLVCKRDAGLLWSATLEVVAA